VDVFLYIQKKNQVTVLLEDSNVDQDRHASTTGSFQYWNLRLARSIQTDEAVVLLVGTPLVVGQ
jgi:hypothetical protein